MSADLTMMSALRNTPLVVLQVKEMQVKSGFEPKMIFPGEIYYKL